MPFLTAEEKQSLLDRYFEIEWCDDVSDLRCVRCHRVAINHYMSNCQHIFCQTCSTFYKDEDLQSNCPQCREYITKLDDQDFDVDVKIHQLKMSCPNKKYGCNYADQLRKFPSHLITCVDRRKAALPEESPGANANVVNQLTNLNSIVGELREGAREVKDKVDQLERKTGDIDGKINSMTSVPIKVEGRNSDTQSASKNYSEEFESMRSQLESVNQRIQQNESLVLQIVDQMSSNMEEMRTKIASMAEEIETHRNTNATELVQKLEKMEAQMQKDGDELRLNLDNQVTTMNKQLETIDNRVTEHENQLTAVDNKVIVFGNEVATLDTRAISDNIDITIINNNLVTIEKKVDATDNRVTKTDEKVENIDKRISDTDKKVDATDNQMTDIDKQVLAINNRLTWMENWQKKLKNIGIFGTLRQKDGCQVSEFTFTVKNIEEEIARGNRYHHIDSEPFYTNIMGYRAKLQVYPNYNNTHHLGLFLSLVVGEFDDIVSWPFNCKFEFHIVSRDDTQVTSFSVDPRTSLSIREALGRPVPNRSTGYGISKYISSGKLLANKDKYLVDGGLSIKVTIWLSN